MNLLIVGAPGAGKGTMSNFIVNDYDLVHISTGDMLREAIHEGTKVGLIAKSYMDGGNLVPDEIIHDIIVERLQKKDIEKGFLFDGYPRTLAQAIDLQEILKSLNKKIDCVINLSIEDEVLVRRITGRRLCPKCGQIYNVYYKPTIIEGVCDECSGTLQLRNDDNVDSLKVRLKEYHKNTEPIIEYYSKMNLVQDINAEQDRHDEFKCIKKILEGIK